MVRRLGNKSKLVHKIVPYFPEHRTYIELFFGAGGMFFNKPRAQYNFLNDLDNELMNCYDILINRKDELIHAIEMLPIHQTMWERAKTEKPLDDLQRAVYFLFLSNWGFMGKVSNLRVLINNTKRITLQALENTFKEIAQNGNIFLCFDFKDAIKSINFRNELDKNNAFIYSDPPYLGTTNNYNTPKWSEKDAIDCFDVTFNSGIKGAMSEFSHPFILELAKERNLQVIEIGERQSLKNRSTEILIINYDLPKQNTQINLLT